MNKFYIGNKDDLRVLIVNTARKKNISEAVIEKDYWVTFILDTIRFSALPQESNAVASGLAIEPTPSFMPLPSWLS